MPSKPCIHDRLELLVVQSVYILVLYLVQNGAVVRLELYAQGLNFLQHFAQSGVPVQSWFSFFQISQLHLQVGDVTSHHSLMASNMHRSLLYFDIIPIQMQSQVRYTEPVQETNVLALNGSLSFTCVIPKRFFNYVFHINQFQSMIGLI